MQNKKIIVIESSDCVCFCKKNYYYELYGEKTRKDGISQSAMSKPTRSIFAAPLRLVPHTLFFPWQPHTRSSLSSGARHRAGIHSHSEWGGWGTSVTLKTRANSRTKPVTSVSHCWSKTISYFLILSLPLSNRMNVFCASCAWSLPAGYGSHVIWWFWSLSNGT